MMTEDAYAQLKVQWKLVCKKESKKHFFEEIIVPMSPVSKKLTAFCFEPEFYLATYLTTEKLFNTIKAVL